MVHPSQNHFLDLTLPTGPDKLEGSLCLSFPPLPIPPWLPATVLDKHATYYLAQQTHWQCKCRAV